MLQECSIIKVAAVFFNEPTSPHYLKEISQKANIAHTSVKSYLIQMKKQSLLKESLQKKGKRYFPIYQANLESKQYRRYKQLYNLLKLQESGLIDSLQDQLMPRSMVLFGSYSRGEDVEDSDIDIFLESKKAEFDIGTFEKKLNRKVQLHFKEHFAEYPPELKNNIINGFLLSGYVKAFK